MSGPVFVFGSNLAGRHGAGAAKWAVKHRGAQYGVGWGLQGNAYAIPTKDKMLHSLPIPIIAEHVRRFIEFAYAHPEMQFQLTAVGCGLAGYKPSDIAPLFNDAPGNVIQPTEFKPRLTP